MHHMIRWSYQKSDPPNPPAIIKLTCTASRGSQLLKRLGIHLERASLVSNRLWAYACFSSACHDLTSLLSFVADFNKMLHIPLLCNDEATRSSYCTSLQMPQHYVTWLKMNINFWDFSALTPVLSPQESKLLPVLSWVWDLLLNSGLNLKVAWCFALEHSSIVNLTFGCNFVHIEVKIWFWSWNLILKNGIWI